MSKSRLVPETELSRQKEYMQRVRELNQGQVRFALVDTYGCQQNEADSEQLRGMLLEMGYIMTEAEEEADVVLLNSCAVREHAELRVLGNTGALSHIKREKKDMVIGVCGCMAQEAHMAEKIKRSYPYVNLVFGTHALYKLPELLYRVLTTKKRVFDVYESEGLIPEGLPVLRSDSVKGWVSVMYGCNNFCSYCIVPYVRGRERSRAPDAIVDEVRNLTENGYKDITFLGQNVNSYGKDLACNTDFSDLLQRINGLPGEFRIRFMTSHPKDAGEKLFDTMAECGKVAKHIHLPFQSGSDRILKLMNRHYDRQQYLGLVEYARKLMPDISITSDIIVGFPGETEEDFQQTLSLVEKVEFDALFTFLYSKRKGTPAAEMEDNTPDSVKKERFDRLLALQNRIAEKKNKLLLGKKYYVLIEREEDPDSELNLVARTDENRPVRVHGDASLIGKFAWVEITKCVKWSMEGKLLD